MGTLLETARRVVHNHYGTTPRHTRGPDGRCRDDCRPCGISALAIEVLGADRAAGRHPDDPMALDVAHWRVT